MYNNIYSLDKREAKKPSTSHYYVRLWKMFVYMIILQLTFIKNLLNYFEEFYGKNLLFF